MTTTTQSIKRKVGDNLQKDIINTTENRQLLYNYLIKYSIEKQGLTQEDAEQFSEQLILKNKNNLFGQNGLSYWLGSRSIEFFCKFYLQDTFTPKEGNTARELAPVHLEIWQELESMFIEDKYDKEEFILPRGSAKTTIIDMALCCFCHAYRKSLYTVVIGKREEDAVEFVEKTKRALQNPYIEYTFGKLVDTKTRTVNKLQCELTNDTQISAFSSGTSIRGTSYTSSKGISRPTLIILDDFINENDILTDQGKEKIVNKFYKEILESGDSAVFRNGFKIKFATKFIVLGTPLCQDDFINTIKNDIEFKVFHRSVVDFNIDEYIENNDYWQTFKSILFNNKLENPKKEAEKYYYEYIDKMKFETIWEKYSSVDLITKYLNNRLSFMQELMCDCESVGERWFKSNRVMTKDEIESLKFIKTMLTIDPAGVKNKNKSKSDSFAFVVGSLAENGFKYIRHGSLVKFNEFDGYINYVINILKEFKQVTHIFVEKNTYNALDADQIERLILKELPNRRIEIINESQRKNKDEKISTVVDSVNNGRIIFCEDRVSTESLKQLMDFCGQIYSLHDDFPDCLSECITRLDDIKIRKNIPIQEKPKGW